MDLRNFGLNEDELRQLGYKVGGAGGDDGASDTGGPSAPGPDGRPTPPARKRTTPALRIWIATLVVLPVVGWVSSLSRRMPDPVPAAGPDASFSSARALAQLVEVAQRPHPTGSPDLIRVRSALLGRLNALGLEPEVQVATAYVRDSSFVRAATVRNVVARIPGSSSTGAIGLIAHFDAAPLSPGAGDNAVGVSTLLEAVRTLQAGEPLRNDLVVVLTDGDEVGLLGSKAFAEEHPWADDVVATVSFESRGSTGPVLVFSALEGDGALVEALAAAGAGRTAASLTDPLRGAALESADGPPGLEPPSLALAALGRRAWEDQSRDVRELVDERTLQHGGEELVALARALGGLDLRRDLDSPGRLYFSLPVVGLVRYPSSWNLLVSLGVLLLWGFVGLVIRMRRGRRNGVLAGLAVGGAAVALSAVAGSFLAGLLADLHPEYGLLSTALYRDGPHVLALVAVAVAVTSAPYGIARRWCRRDEVLFGALAIPLAYVLWLTFATPAAAPAAQWPLAIALAGTLLVTLLGPLRGGSVWTWALVLLLSASTVVLVVPSLEMVSQALTLRAASSLGALFGLTTLLFLPVMDWLRRPKFWATPLVTLAAAAALVALNLPAVRGSVDHPEPTTLVYLTDEAASADPILRGSELEPDTTGVRTMLGQWLTVPGPGEEWARSWVAEAPTGPTAPGTLLIGEAEALYEIAGSGPDAELAPPSITVTGSADAGERRNLVLEVRSGLRGEMMGFAVPDGVDAEITGVGSASWPVGGVPTRQMVHWGLPDGGTLRIRLSLPAAATRTELVVLEHHLRPQEVLGDYFFQRADSLIANAAMGSDRVIQRTDVVVDVPVAPVSPLGGEEPPGSEDALEPAQ